MTPYFNNYPGYTSYNPYAANRSHSPFSAPAAAQSLIKVNGIEGAKAYQMRPNSSAALFDANEDLFYIKFTDGAGFPSIKTYGFVEMEPQAQQQKADYLTRAEFEEFKKEITKNAK